MTTNNLKKFAAATLVAFAALGFTAGAASADPTPQLQKDNSTQVPVG